MIKEKSVLVVEKRGRSGFTLAEAVTKALFKAEVRFVEDGAELMDFLQHRGQYGDASLSPAPSLILLDLDGTGGYESAGELKKHPEFRRIPLVVFTASLDEADVRRGYEMGANSLIQRTDSGDRLVEALKVLQHYWLESVELPSTR